MSKKRIGEYLVDAGVITEEKIRNALENKKESQKIGDYLVERGHISEDILFENLSEQLKIPLIRLRDSQIDSELLEKFDNHKLKEHVVFPLELTGSLVTLVTADPLDDSILEYYEKEMDYEFTTVLGLKSEVLEYIDKYFGIDSTMMESFGISNDYSDVGKGVVPVLEVVRRYVLENKFVELVIIDRGNGRLEIEKGSIPGLSRSDYGVLLGFVKDSGDFSEGYGFVHSKELSEYGVDISLLQRDTFGSKEHRLVIDGGVVTDRSDRDIKLWNVSGKNVRDSVERKIKGIAEQGDRLAVLSNDVSYGRLGCIRSDVGVEVSKLAAFADVFIIVDAWKDGVGDTVIDLMMRGKEIVLVYPGSWDDVKEHLEKYGGKGQVRMMDRLYGNIVEKQEDRV